MNRKTGLFVDPREKSLFLWATFSVAFLLIVIALLIITPLSSSAKTKFPKGYGHDRSREITVAEPLGWPIAVRASSYVAGNVESLPGMAVIRLTPYNPWWRFWSGVGATTTVNVSGLPENAPLHIYTSGYREHQVLKTSASGSLLLDFPSKTGTQFIIKSKPSTYHIALDPLFGPPGGDCSSIGTWDATAKTCTLTGDVDQTIAIEDDGITLDGDNHTVTGAGSGDGVYVDVANAVVKNLSISNFARGVVYSAPFSLFSIPTGGPKTNAALSNIARNIKDEGISNLNVSNVVANGGDVGFFLTDKDLDGFPTYNVSITGSIIENASTGLYVNEVSPVSFVRNNLINNSSDLSIMASAVTLATVSDRGNFWDKFTGCVQDPANPNYCTNS